MNMYMPKAGINCLIPNDKCNIDRWFYANGDMVCTECNLKFIDHPVCMQSKYTFDGYYYYFSLHVICSNSRHVKL